MRTEPKADALQCVIDNFFAKMPVYKMGAPAGGTNWGSLGVQSFLLWWGLSPAGRYLWNKRTL